MYAISAPTNTATNETMIRFRSSPRWSSIGMRASGVRRDRFLRRSLIMPRDQLPGARNREGAWAPRAGAGTDRRGVAGHCGGGGAAERAGAEDASAVTPGVAAGRNRDGAGRPVPAMGVGG